MTSQNERPLKLYRVEFIEEDSLTVDWIWFESTDEANEYLATRSDLVSTYRKATKDEEDLYDSAYEDGYGMATAEERLDAYNGITFRLNSFNPDDADLDTTKMFQCSECGEHKDFETDVAVANGYYICAYGQDSDQLWHICYDCASMDIEVTFDN